MVELARWLLLSKPVTGSVLVGCSRRRRFLGPPAFSRLLEPLRLQDRKSRPGGQRSQEDIRPPDHFSVHTLDFLISRSSRSRETGTW
jgi:hypothetical protein